MKKVIGCLLVIVGVMVAAFPSAAQGSNTTGKTDTEKKAAAKSGKAPSETRPAAGSEDPNYVIGPEDVIDVSVWKEPDVSRTVPVRPDGMISLPLLNDVHAAGLTPIQLAGQITEQLRKFLTEPQVTVIVVQINSRRYYITGEVGHTGAVPLMHDTTILEALSSAGGFSQFAKLGSIYVMRTEGDKRIKIPVNYKKLMQGDPKQDFLLKPGDTIVVP